MASLTAEQRRARNAGYQARWRAKREALVRANPEVVEGAERAKRGELSDQGRIALADRLADAAMGHLQRSRELAGWARKVRTAER